MDQDILTNSISAASIKTAYESNADTNAFTDALQTKLNTTDVFDEDGTYANLRAQATTASDVGLGNVTNESKATMFTDAALTGVPIAPTATSSTNTTQIATTAFVLGEIAVIDGGEFN
jgi:ribosomal protein L30E